MRDHTNDCINVLFNVASILKDVSGLTINRQRELVSAEAERLVDMGVPEDQVYMAGLRVSKVMEDWTSNRIK